MEIARLAAGAAKHDVYIEDLLACLLADMHAKS
jgi:hypothetical protein